MISDAELAGAARAAMAHSYSPYSGFAVGAAVLVEDGTVYSAANVENASYGLTVCAERAAIFKAVGEGSKHVVALAVASATRPAAVPCGACLQVMAEFNPGMKVLMVDADGNIESALLSELLPRPFSG